MGRIRSRLIRLERELGTAAERPLPIWQLINGSMTEADLSPDELERWRAMWVAAKADSARASEASPAGKLYREQLARLGLPQPDTLADIDVIGEAIRLVGVRSA
jgi:hypothetical protein